MSCPIMVNTNNDPPTQVVALTNECYPSSNVPSVTFFYGDPITYGQSTSLVYAQG